VAAAGRPPGARAGPALVVIAPGLARGPGGLARGPGGLARGPGGPAVTRGQGQQLARAELSKAVYHPGVPFTERIERAIARLLNAAGASVPVGWWSVVALAALLVIVAAAAAYWIGPVMRSRRSRALDPLLSAGQRTARDHRQEAERRAAAGDYSAAIIESVRATAVELEERGILPPRPGRTADEFAAEAGQPLPRHAAALREAARLFDDVRYGERPGTAAGYQRARDVDAQVRSARPAGGAAPPAGALPPVASSAAGPAP
jgi:Domain of unknown function (DUF4129)